MHTLEYAYCTRVGASSLVKSKIEHLSQSIHEATNTNKRHREWVGTVLGQAAAGAAQVVLRSPRGLDLRCIRSFYYVARHVLLDGRH